MQSFYHIHVASPHNWSGKTPPRLEVAVLQTQRTPLIAGCHNFDLRNEISVVLTGMWLCLIHRLCYWLSRIICVCVCGRAFTLERVSESPQDGEWVPMCTSVYPAMLCHHGDRFKIRQKILARVDLKVPRMLKLDIAEMYVSSSLIIWGQRCLKQWGCTIGDYCLASWTPATRRTSRNGLKHLASGGFLLTSSRLLFCLALWLSFWHIIGTRRIKRLGQQQTYSYLTKDSCHCWWLNHYHWFSMEVNKPQC